MFVNEKNEIIFCEKMFYLIEVLSKCFILLNGLYMLVEKSFLVRGLYNNRGKLDFVYL